MSYYVYVIVINDVMCVRYIEKNSVWRRISKNNENISNIMSTGGDGACRWI